MPKDISTTEFNNLIKSGKAEIIDVREADEYALIRIKGAKLIPGSELSARQGEIDWQKPVVFYCRSGARSRLAVNFFARAGKDAFNLSGGIKAIYEDKDFDNLEIPEDEAVVRNYLA
ncbi:MAG: rhodanese-like domain-containing protein [Candidatus Falkowbacteria bacterium]